MGLGFGFGFGFGFCLGWVWVGFGSGGFTPGYNLSPRREAVPLGLGLYEVYITDNTFAAIETLDAVVGTPAYVAML